MKGNGSMDAPPISPDRSPVMTLKQAADYLQVSKAHLSNVISGRVLGVPPVRSFRLGRRILIKREWIDEWLETNRGVTR
jgi:excisionase family DNA binding protein